MKGNKIPNPYSVDTKKIADIIINLKNEDLKLRDKLIQTGQLDKGYNEEMQKLHNRNAEILSGIIDAIGYPTIDKVGKETSEAAWLVIQHAIAKPDFMRKCAQLLERAVGNQKASSIDLAYLSDRIAVLEGRPQQYGTQFDWDENGELNPNLLDDTNKVNQRRKSIGMNTLEEQTAIMRERVKREHQSPSTDFDTRKKEMDEWRRKTGWI